MYIEFSNRIDGSKVNVDVVQPLFWNQFILDGKKKIAIRNITTNCWIYKDKLYHEYKLVTNSK